MYYLIFCKKNSGMKGPFPVAKLISAYTDAYGKDDICILLPGYMSTKLDSIWKFKKELNISENTYFTSGMNGRKILGKWTIQLLHNIPFKRGCIIGAKVKGKDHSKMIFFLDKDSKPNNIIVKALLIGSSNQSYSTYFGNSYQGEADVFIIDSEAIKDNVSDNPDDNIVSVFSRMENDCIITKEIGASNRNTLNNIFESSIESFYITPRIKCYF